MRFGSSAMATGTSLLSTIANLRFAAGSEMTETTVTSDPVPAVVGMAKNGSHRAAHLEVAVERVRTAALSRCKR